MAETGAKNWYVKTEDGKVYGPAPFSSLLAWARGGRILASSMISNDRRRWTLAPQVAEFEMHWLVELAPGQVYGPFNRAVVIQAFRDHALPPNTKFYRLHPYAPDQDPPPKIVEKIVEVSKPWWFAWPWKKEQKASERIFGNMTRDQLRSLEVAAQKEVVRSREYKMQRQLKMQEQVLIERKV